MKPSAFNKQIANIKATEWERLYRELRAEFTE